MSTDTDTISEDQKTARRALQTKAGLLIVHAFPGSFTSSRCLVDDSVTVGRQSDNDLPVKDRILSRHHFEITCDRDHFWLNDLGTKNHTYINGTKVEGKHNLSKRVASVIRAGQTLFVFHHNAGAMLHPPAQNFGMVGPFHLQGMLEQLLTAALSARHILLTGPSGSGKELAARALAAMRERTRRPFVAYNAARYTSPEEATSTLFGVGKRVFSNVDARPGLIEQAADGTLFIDEVHNLPEQVQRSLLRVTEEGVYSRFGEQKERETDAHIVFASNSSEPTYSIAKDLFARLRHENVPSLSDRVADIPAIFNHALKNELNKYGVEESETQKQIGADHYETLCLDGFPQNNIRGLIDLADRLATRIARGMEPSQAINVTFNERFPDDPVALRNLEKYGGQPRISFDTIEFENGDSRGDTDAVSHYELNRKIITAVFEECDGNISKTERALKKRGVQASRHWLTVYLERWGLR